MIVLKRHGGIAARRVTTQQQHASDAGASANFACRAVLKEGFAAYLHIARGQSGAGDASVPDGRVTVPVARVRISDRSRRAGRLRSTMECPVRVVGLSWLVSAWTEAPFCTFGSLIAMCGQASDLSSMKRAQ